jgi:hypothetical protein
MIRPDRNHVGLPPMAAYALFGLSLLMAPAVLTLGAIGGTLAAMAQRPRVRR